MDKIHYMRMAMEKDAGFESIGRFGMKALKGLKSFANKPISATLKKLFWTRAKPGEIGKNIKSELGYGVKWGGGLAVGGVVATPMFTSRNI